MVLLYISWICFTLYYKEPKRQIKLQTQLKTTDGDTSIFSFATEDWEVLLNRNLKTETLLIVDRKKYLLYLLAQCRFQSKKEIIGDLETSMWQNISNAMNLKICRILTSFPVKVLKWVPRATKKIKLVTGQYEVKNMINSSRNYIFLTFTLISMVNKVNKSNKYSTNCRRLRKLPLSVPVRARSGAWNLIGVVRWLVRLCSLAHFLIVLFVREAILVWLC